jgi:hypothetical protein
MQSMDDRMQKKERKATTDRNNHRQYIDKAITRLEDWEENLLQREQTFECHTSTMENQYARYSRKYGDLQQQTEKAITAWHEVAQASPTDKIDAETKAQVEKIEDFATNHEKQLRRTCPRHPSETSHETSCGY